jgi:hypothetical protein
MGMAEGGRLALPGRGRQRAWRVPGIQGRDRKLPRTWHTARRNTRHGQPRKAFLKPPLLANFPRLQGSLHFRGRSVGGGVRERGRGLRSRGVHACGGCRGARGYSSHLAGGPGAFSKNEIGGGSGSSGPSYNNPHRAWSPSGVVGIATHTRALSPSARTSWRLEPSRFRTKMRAQHPAQKASPKWCTHPVG